MTQTITGQDHENATQMRYKQWFLSTKQQLLKSEPANIQARVQHFEDIVNSLVTTLINQDLHLNVQSLQSVPLFKCTINVAQHLQFLINWPGLRTCTSPSSPGPTPPRGSAPTSQREYEKKSKNWLNGRRAPNYGRTLFPRFIRLAEEHFERVSKLLVEDKTRQETIYRVLMYRVLARLCGCNISPHEQAKRSPFFCKNSVERKGELRNILQKYAADHQYVHGFPSCAQEAVDYFTQKANSFAAMLNDAKGGAQSRAQGRARANRVSTSVSTNRVRLQQPANAANDANGIDWKAEAERLQKCVVAETQRRIEAENQRDQLWQMLYTQQSQTVPQHPSVPPMIATNPIQQMPTPAMPAPYQLHTAPEDDVQGQQMFAALLDFLAQNTSSNTAPQF